MNRLSSIALLVASLMLVASVAIMSPRQSTTAKAAETPHFGLVAPPSCHKMIMERMHGSQEYTLPAQEYLQFKRDVAACGGKLVELDEKGNPKE